MIIGAASTQFYESAGAKKYSHVHFLTIQRLLTGIDRAEHPGDQWT